MGGSWPVEASKPQFWTSLHLQSLPARVLMIIHHHPISFVVGCSSAHPPPTWAHCHQSPCPQWTKHIWVRPGTSTVLQRSADALDAAGAHFAQRCERPAAIHQVASSTRPRSCWSAREPETGKSPKVLPGVISRVDWSQVLLRGGCRAPSLALSGALREHPDFWEHSRERSGLPSRPTDTRVLLMKSASWEEEVG